LIIGALMALAARVYALRLWPRLDALRERRRSALAMVGLVMVINFGWGTAVLLATANGIVL
jgi:hypothetical protein